MSAAVLGGVIDNRAIAGMRFSLAPELLTDDLSVFEDDPDVESYTAIFQDVRSFVGPE